VEHGLHDRVQDHLRYRLRHAIGNGWNAEGARATVVFLDLDEPHGRRMVGARRHPVPDLVEISLQVLLEHRQGTHHPRPQHRGSPSPAGRLSRRVALECRKALPQTPAPPITGWPAPLAGESGPFAPPALPGFIAPTDPSVPGPRIGTRLLMGPPLGGLPWHQGTGSHVPHKSHVPVSRRLHAGRRSDSRQASSELHPRPTTGAWFRRHPYAFDASSTVHSRSSYQYAPDGLVPPFPQRSPPQPLCRRSLRWFEP
jgi:hypothetical protein